MEKLKLISIFTTLTVILVIIALVENSLAVKSKFKKLNKYSGDTFVCIFVCYLKVPGANSIVKNAGRFVKEEMHGVSTHSTQSYNLISQKNF